MAELKKCPFCGGEVKYEEFDDGFFAWGRVKCQCGVMLTTPKKAIINAWNNRVTEAEIRAKAIDDCIKIISRETHSGTLCDYLEQLKECE